MKHQLGKTNVYKLYLFYDILDMFMKLKREKGSKRKFRPQEKCLRNNLSNKLN